MIFNLAIVKHIISFNYGKMLYSSFFDITKLNFFLFIDIKESTKKMNQTLLNIMC